MEKHDTGEHDTGEHDTGEHDMGRAQHGNDISLCQTAPEKLLCDTVAINIEGVAHTWLLLETRLHLCLNDILLIIIITTNPSIFNK